MSAATPAGTLSTPEPTAVASAQWGGYNGRDEACTQTANNVISLGLVPTNLSFATDQASIEDIRSTIQNMGDLAPAALHASYLSLATLVERYYSELPGDATTAETTAPPTASSSFEPQSPAPSASGADSNRPSPHLDSEGYKAQVDEIASWLKANCSG